MNEICILEDFETRAEISVVDVGVWQYVLHPSHEVLCVGWRVKEAAWGPVNVAIVVGGKDGRRAVERRVEERGHRISTLGEFFADKARATLHAAHNTGFEQGVEYRHFPHLKPLEQRWTCTASRARRLGLPGSLEDACKVLRTPHQKSMEGHGVMLQCSQPRPQWRSSGVGDKYFDDADRLAKSAIYCAEDIFAECDLHDYLPELPPQERHFWEQTERRNQRGIRLDRPLIETMSHVVTSSAASIGSIVKKITKPWMDIAHPGQEFELTNISLIRELCSSRRVYLPDMRAATVAAMLDEHRRGVLMDEEAATILEARQQVGGKSSNSKLVRMRQRMGVDDCARDIAIYHGAHTGRMTGEGINVLNLPKPYEGFDQEFVVECLMKQELARLRAEQKVAPAVAVSAALRGVIVPRPGKKLVIADYATVEPCCLFTMARQWDAVEALRRREDLYCMFGSDILGRKINKKDDPLLRSVFKSAVLGAGFQMGLPRFLSYLEANKVFVSEDIARLAHEGYRKRFPKVPEFWNGVHEAAKSAIRFPGRVFSYNDITYHSDGWWLVCTLPSGRPFMYPHVRLLPGKFNDEITYEGWVRIDGRPAGWGDVRTFGGMLTENLTQSICRDIMEEDKDEIEQLPGWNVLLDVYDELVAEAPIDERDAVPRMLGIMGRSPSWFPMMPVAAEGFEAMRYRKQD